MTTSIKVAWFVVTLAAGSAGFVVSAMRRGPMRRR